MHTYSIENSQTLAITSNLLPITSHILQISAKVRKRPLKDLAVELSAHSRFKINIISPRRSRVRKNIIRSFLHSSHERSDFLWVLLNESIITNIQNRAEAAASELSEFVDPKHLDVVFGTTLRGEPFGEFDHLDVLEADSGVDFAFDDGFGDVHAAADGGVVVWGHAVVGGELVDLYKC